MYENNVATVLVSLLIYCLTSKPHGSRIPSAPLPWRPAPASSAQLFRGGVSVLNAMLVGKGRAGVRMAACLLGCLLSLPAWRFTTNSPKEEPLSQRAGSVVCDVHGLLVPRRVGPPSFWPRTPLSNPHLP